MQSFASSQAVDEEESFDMGSIDDLPDEKTFNSEEISNEVLLDKGLSGASTEASNTLEFSPVAEVLSDNQSDVELPSVKVESSTIKSVVVDNTKVDVMDFGLTFDLPKAATETLLNTPTNDESEKSTNLFLNTFGAAEESSFTDVQTVQAEEISFDFPLSEEQDLPSFDGDVTSDHTLDAKGFDFSTINLDLDDVDSDELIGSASDGSSVEIASAAVAENQDVDIKLDLVAAYIDMDDKDGARELLDEVMKEGGPQQKQRAEQLLASIA